MIASLWLLALAGCAPVKVGADDSVETALSSDDSRPQESGDDALDSQAPVETAQPHVEEEEVEDFPTTYDHLPVMMITASGSIGDGDKTPGWMELIQDHDGTLTDLDDAPRTWEGNIGIEIHGASSSADPKHCYRMELRDDAGDDLDYPLLGLGSDSDYVLHASYGDKTYLRNAFAYRIGRLLGEDTGEWQPGTAFSEVFLNGTYMGIYVVTERVKRDKDRLDIGEPATTAEDGDITGGYLFKVDYNRGDYLTTAKGTLVEPMDPRTSELSSDQRTYVKTWLDSFETMLGGDDYDDPDSGYTHWINEDGWVDFILINELAHNVDAYRLSTYHYKERDEDGGLFHAGPIWDFDRAFGNVNYCSCWETDGWIIDDLAACGAYYQFPFWWEKLLQNEDFRNKLRCRWEQLRADELSDASMLAMIEEMAAEVAEAEPRDHGTWGTLGVNVGYNYYVGATWDDELTWFEDWLTERAAWMDDNVWGTCSG